MKKNREYWSRSFGFTAMVLGSCLLPVSESQASTIVNPGYDLFVTDSETTEFADFAFEGVPLRTFDFGPPFGVQNVGHSDTIVRRIDPAIDPGMSVATTINIEVVGLSMVSVDQIDLGFGVGYYYATLNTAMPSTGTMDITFNANHGNPDLPDAGGTWDSTFDLNWNISYAGTTKPEPGFDPADAGPPVRQGTHRFITSEPVDWSHDPLVGEILIDGVNHNLNGIDGSTDFFSGPAFHNSGDPNTSHGVLPPIPEVTSSFVLAGLLGFSAFMRKRS